MNFLVAKSLHILIIFEWLRWLLCLPLWVYSPCFFALLCGPHHWAFTLWQWQAQAGHWRRVVERDGWYILTHAFPPYGLSLATFLHWWWLLCLGTLLPELSFQGVAHTMTLHHFFLVYLNLAVESSSLNPLTYPMAVGMEKFSFLPF